MHNSFWYILLALASTLLFIYTCVKRWNRKLIVLYLFIAGVTYSFEYIVLVLLNSYVYKPLMLENRYYDNMLGAMFSDAFTVPMSSVFVAAFSLPLGARLLVIGIILLIEWAFQHLGIYDHYWWHYVFTAAGLFIAFYLAQKWLNLLTQALTPAVRFWTLFSINFALQSTVVFVVGVFYDAYHMHLGLFANPTRDHLMFATMQSYVLCFMFAFVVCARNKWIWVPITLITYWLVLNALMKYGLLQFSPGWKLIHLFIFRAIPLPLLFLVDRYILRNGETHTAETV